MLVLLVRHAVDMWELLPDNSISQVRLLVSCYISGSMVICLGVTMHVFQHRGLAKKEQELGIKEIVTSKYGVLFKYIPVRRITT